MQKIFKKLFSGLRSMSRPTYLIIKYSLIVSCILLLASLVVFIRAGEFSASTYKLFDLAKRLYDTPVSILLIAAIASVCVEERLHK